MSGRVLIRPLAVAAALAALVPLSVAHAADGAGTASMFAQGAGNRSLALGGTGVALGDDPSAAVWNPAGLGGAQRYELQVTHADYGLDLNEDFAVLALPSWRWGTAALSLRRFGTGGIEQRDDRNVLIGSDLQDSESEVALAFGRSLGPAWSLGAAFKLQRQALAGRSASGLGADLGVRVHPLVAAGMAAPWGDRLSFGLAYRNAIEPSLRLDMESVPDPGRLRAGLAWTTSRGTIALDLDKPRDAGTVPHLGIEALPHPLLALRAGLNDGHLTAGAGIRVQSLGLDYAFEDSPLGGVSRFGASFALGASADQRRVAAQRAEEQRLEARLAEGFRRQQAVRVDQLLGQARAAAAEQRPDDALELLATLLTLEPGEPRAQALARDILLAGALDLERAGDPTAAALAFGRALEYAPEDSTALAGQGRCRAESDRRAARSEELRRQFGTALDDFGSGRLAEARAGFARIVAARPEDQDARAMLERTDGAIATRVAELLDDARRTLAAGRPAEAADVLARASALDPRAPGIALVSTAVQQARSAEKARVARATTTPAAPAAGGRPALSPQRAREVADLYRRGLAALEQHRSEDALRYLELTWMADPGYEQVAEYLKHEYLTRGLESFSAGRLDDAIALWESALRVDPQDQRARGYLERARKQQARTREILGAR